MTDVERIIKQVADVVKSQVSGDYRLFLFGSRAVESPDHRADIDIGILADRPLSARQMVTIKEKIEELPTLLKIDFVDLTAAGERFRSIALQHTREIAA
jgi:predicted nucleotidyltransferase